MDRREFIGSTLGGIAAAHLPGRAGDTGRSDGDSLPRARWLENGLIDAGGNHEPYIFTVRRGAQRRDAYAQHLRDQSEPLIRRLKEQGIEVFHTHLYKGFGMAAEREGMEETRRAAGIVHRYGMKIDTYIQWNTMMYETFFVEEPRAKEWIQRDAVGRPILLSYGFQQTFRCRPCFSRQEYRDYLKNIVRYAVLEVKTDFIHFDNFTLSAEPDSCHCSACTEGFRKFLRTKYSSEKRRERLGFDTVDCVNPPEWNTWNRPEKMELICDPVIQEWIDYRCQAQGDALREIALYAKSLNPEVAIEVNCEGIVGANHAWGGAIDYPRILKWTEAFWSEEDGSSGYQPDGRLISRIRSFKLGRAFRNQVLTYISDNPVAMAECLAFNQTIGFAGVDPLPPAMLNYIDFYRRHRDLFVASEDVAPVALLRSFASLAYHGSGAQLAAVLVEQALIQARVPFGLIFDDQLGDLARCKVLILPNSECLSDEQLALIRRFVEEGGGLVAIRQAGIYDEWGRLREEPGLRDLVDGQPRGEDYPEYAPGSNASSKREFRGPVTHKEVGRGRAAYVPDVLFDGPRPEWLPYFAIRHQFWKRPQNWLEIIEAVRWATGSDLPIEVSGPEFLAANLISQPDKRRMILHLVNFGANTNPAIESVKVLWRPPAGGGSKEVRILSPDGGNPDFVTATVGPSGMLFSIPEVRTYVMAVLSY